MTLDQPAGAAMKLAIVVFLLAVLTVAATTMGFALWDDHIGHRDMLRPIHYDTQYNNGAQNRLPPN